MFLFSLLHYLVIIIGIVLIHFIVSVVLSHHCRMIVLYLVIIIGIVLIHFIVSVVLSHHCRMIVLYL